MNRLINTLQGFATIGLLIMVASMLSACGTTKVRRTEENDAMLRVIIDPRIEVSHYVQIQRALVQSGKFEVIDRRDGFEAAVNEQDLQFRSGYQDRFSDREKWAHLGRMFGARGIILAHADCYQKTSFWGDFRKYCKQTLTFVDGYTGKVEFAVTNTNDEPWVVGYSVPDWDDTVARAVKEYPEYFKPRKTDKLLDQYMDQSEELAKRERSKQQEAKRPVVPQSNQAQPQSLKEDFQVMRSAAQQMQQLDQETGE